MYFWTCVYVRVRVFLSKGELVYFLKYLWINFNDNKFITVIIYQGDSKNYIFKIKKEI